MTVAELEEKVRMLEDRLAILERRSMPQGVSGKTFADLEGCWAHLPATLDDEIAAMKYQIPKKVWDAL